MRCPGCGGGAVVRHGCGDTQPHRQRYRRKAVCHGRGGYARDEDGDGCREVHVNTPEGFWLLLRSWLRPHRGLSQERLPLSLGFFALVDNARRRGKALLGQLVAALVARSAPTQHPGSR